MLFSCIRQLFWIETAFWIPSCLGFNLNLFQLNLKIKMATAYLSLQEYIKSFANKNSSQNTSKELGIALKLGLTWHSKNPEFYKLTLLANEVTIHFLNPSIYAQRNIFRDYVFWLGFFLNMFNVYVCSTFYDFCVSKVHYFHSFEKIHITKIATTGNS